MCPSQFQFGYVMDGDWVVVGPAILCIKKTKLRLRSVAKRSEAYLNLFFFDTRIAEPHYFVLFLKSTQ